MNGPVDIEVGTILLCGVACGGGFILLFLALAVRGVRNVILISFGAYVLLWGAGLLVGVPLINAAHGNRAPLWGYIQAAAVYLLPVPLAGYLVGRFGPGKNAVYTWVFRASSLAALVAILSDALQSQPGSALPGGWVFGEGWNIALFLIALPLGYYAVRSSLIAARRSIFREQEMESARQLNFVLIPRELGTMQNLRIARRYVPARSPKGNFSDIMPVGDSRVCIMIGGDPQSDDDNPQREDREEIRVGLLRHH